MLIAEKLLDVLILATAVVMGLMLHKKWHARGAIVLSFCLAVLWSASHQPPRWLGGAAPLLVDLATFGLAYLGGHVAINPPRETDKVLKKVYVFTFALLLVIGISANVWQRSIENDKQDKLQQNETAAREQFSSNLRDVKRSSEAILNFVANPPKGFTQDQIASVVSKFIDQHDKRSSTLSEEALRVMVPAIIAEIRRLTDRWYFDDGSLERQQHEALLEATPDKNPDERAKIDQAFIDRRKRRKADYAGEITPVLRSANYLQEEMLRGQTLTDEDYKFSDFAYVPTERPYDGYSQVMAFAGYLERLLNRLRAQPSRD